MKDTFHGSKIAASLAPAVQTATLKGDAVDLQGFGSALLAVTTGAIVGAGLFDLKMQESNTTTDGDFTDVAADDLLGTMPVSLAASTIYRQGYIGSKRYVRAAFTKQSGTSIAAGAAFVLGHPALA
jgi:hypothetical protein